MKHRWLETLVPGQPPPGRIVQRVAHGGNAAWHALIMTQTVHSVSPSRPSFLVRFHRLPDSGVAANPTERQIELFDQLSPSEREIARLVVAGHSNAEIAVRLHKQISTVKTQLTSIFTKLNVKNRNRLTALLQG
jgi:DNA-binding CsgD family transcriptional regulator